jgi:processive 1,2-diacylglycerol beta-glucosyltransferase
VHAGKKILILTAGFGEGHNTAARNVRAAIEELTGDAASACTIDPIAECYGRANDFAKKTYLGVINHIPIVWQQLYEMFDSTTLLEAVLPALAPMRDKLVEILDAERPDAVVSTYPLYGFLLDQIFDGGKARDFPFFTIVTDSITINSVWFRPASDYFIVANEQTAHVLRTSAVPERKIKVLGFPVTLQFANASPKLPPSNEHGRRVLFMINFAKADAPQLTRRLLEIPDIELTVTVGRDPELQAAVEAVIERSGRAVEVFGWTPRMPELLMRSHVVIAKAGGATVQEAIAAKTPMIASQVVPGQEEGNARLLVENECGALAESHDAIAQTVGRAFENGAGLWLKWSANICKLSRPDAAREIARFVLDRAGRTGEKPGDRISAPA